MTEVIKGTRRPDGTYRKDVVRKAGYVPEDEQEKYHDKFKVQGPKGVPGADTSEAATVKQPLTKSAKKNAARKAKKQDGGAEALAANDDAPGGRGGHGGRRDEAGADGDGGNGACLANGAGVTSESGSGAGGAGGAGGASGAGADAGALLAQEVSRRLRAARKKLRHVDELLEQQAAGAALNDDQCSKLGKRLELLADVSFLESLAAPPAAAAAMPVDGSPVDAFGKRLRALRKKARQVDELAERAHSGPELTDEQRAKLAAALALSREIDQLAQILAAVGVSV